MGGRLEAQKVNGRGFVSLGDKPFKIRVTSSPHLHSFSC